MYHDLPDSASFWSFLLTIDQDLAETARKNGCPCGGHLHCSNVGAHRLGLVGSSNFDRRVRDR